MAYYCPVGYTEGHPSKGAVEKALAGVEHWLPEFKPLPLTRRCVRGWGKLRPPQPKRPPPRQKPCSPDERTEIVRDPTEVTPRSD